MQNKLVIALSVVAAIALILTFIYTTSFTYFQQCYIETYPTKFEKYYMVSASYWDCPTATITVEEYDAPMAGWQCAIVASAPNNFPSDGAGTCTITSLTPNKATISVTVPSKYCDESQYNRGYTISYLKVTGLYSSTQTCTNPTGSEGDTICGGVTGNLVLRCTMGSWVSSTSCPAGCSNGQCISNTDECTQEFVFRCKNGNIEMCTTLGGYFHWEVYQNCPVGCEMLDATHAQCIAQQTCSPLFSWRCVGNEQQMCDHTGWESYGECSEGFTCVELGGGGITCQKDENGGPQNCVSGSLRCSADYTSIEVCNNNQWTVGSVCSDSVCVESGGQVMCQQAACTPNWQCTAWSDCVDNVQTKTCVDANGCGTDSGKPATSQACEVSCAENWQCTQWSTCIDNEQTRTCVDANSCGTFAQKPAISQECGSETCTEDWDCTDWSTCVGGSQTRTCIDLNNCGTTTNKPSLLQTCTGGNQSCTPNIQCTEWSDCINNVQTRLCSDGCGNVDQATQACGAIDLPFDLNDKTTQIILVATLAVCVFMIVILIITRGGKKG